MAGRQPLMVVLALLGAVPVISGLAGLVFGTAIWPGGADASASVDSNYRFIDAYWLAAGVLLWWSLFRLAERAKVTRLILVVAVLGGVGRLLSVAMVGWPTPVLGTAMVLELVVLPLVAWWHARVVRAGAYRHNAAARTPAAPAPSRRREVGRLAPRQDPGARRLRRLGPRR